MTKQTRQELRMRPDHRRRTGIRALHRATLGGAVALLLAGGAATVLTHQQGPVSIAFVTSTEE
jgi:hypothetical protein